MPARPATKPACSTATAASAPPPRSTARTWSASAAHPPATSSRAWPVSPPAIRASATASTSTSAASRARAACRPVAAHLPGPGPDLQPDHHQGPQPAGQRLWRHRRRGRDGDAEDR
ncbi:hypothetical protein G6F46_015152 [Rhizopus delemar]|nr:hypothetical protein G6F46_015152 [Rhizopus delemar]